MEMTQPSEVRFTVEPSDAGTRLDRFLKERFPDVSRSALQRQIEAHQVTVNGKPVPPHHFLRAGETILVEPLRNPAVALRPIENHGVRIVWEDDAMAVVEKPSGLLTHPLESRDEPSLVNDLLARYPTLAGVGEDPLRPGIVHRLDRDVSGLLVVAKTPEAFRSLKAQFQARTVEKTYAAVVYGSFVRREGMIELPIARSKTRGAKMAARPKGGAGREAVTRFTVVAQNPDYAFLRVQPETGRMHQIRVHLAATGHPIVGDPLYHRRGRSAKNVHRLLLHAERLAFRDLAGAWRVFQSPLPQEIATFLVERLKRNLETFVTIDSAHPASYSTKAP